MYMPACSARLLIACVIKEILFELKTMNAVTSYEFIGITQLVLYLFFCA